MITKEISIFFYLQFTSQHSIELKDIFQKRIDKIKSTYVETQNKNSVDRLIFIDATFML